MNRPADGRSLRRRSRIPAPALVLALAVVLLLLGDLRPAAGPEAGSEAGSGAWPGSAQAATTSVRWGPSINGVPQSMSPLDSFASAAGKRPSLVMWFVSWSEAFPADGVRKVVARSARPVISWEPWGVPGQVDQSAYRLSRITSGAHDSYIRTWARAARDSGQLIWLRFAPEMNGNWTSWSEGVNGNRSGDFVKAWRHVRSIFVSVGATNVRWVWTPITPYEGSVPLSRVFPGDSYVDYVGLDGYNWGTVKPNIGWKSFRAIFALGLTAVSSLSAKPLVIGEMASTELGGDKAAWISGFFSALRDYLRVRAFVWFNHLKETDWRITSSERSRAAFATGVADGRFLSGT